MVIKSIKSFSLFGFFETICDLVYFYTSLAFSIDLYICCQVRIGSPNFGAIFFQGDPKIAAAQTEKFNRLP
jgi:hypothetical protein